MSSKALRSVGLGCAAVAGTVVVLFVGSAVVAALYDVVTGRTDSSTSHVTNLPSSSPYVAPPLGHPATGSRANAPVASEPAAANVQHIVGHQFGCINRSYLQELIQLAADRDRVAWENKLNDGVDRGACVQFEPGETVYIDDTALISGLIRVRRRGDTRLYWTVMQATN